MYTVKVQKRPVRNYFSFLLYVLAIFGILLNATGVSYAALSEKQKSLYNSGILYYEYDYGQCNVKSATTSNANLYMLGDSYSQGLSSDSINIGGAFKDAGYENVEINAVQGRSITGDGNDPTRSQSGIQAVDADQITIKQAGTIIIELGTNPNSYNENIPLLMNDINALNAGAKKYWVNVNHYQADSTANIKEANDAIDKYAEKFGYTVIDWEKESTGKRDWFESSGLHPNQTGYAALRDLIVASVSKPVTGDLGDIAGLSNPDIIWRFLIGKGLTPNQTAGWMANIKAESGYDPAAIEGNGEGHGLVQWSFGRKTNLLNEAEKQGVDWRDIKFQLNFMWEEMTTSYKRVYEMLVASSTAQEAHDIIIKEYEKPAETYRNQRIAAAPPILAEILATYAGVSGLSLGDDKCTNTGLRLPSGTGWDLEGPNAMVYYRQDDPKWADDEYGNCISSTGSSTIGSAGCGIASMAMIVSTLTSEQVDPPAMAKIAVDNGYRANDGGACDGTSHALKNYVADRYNLKLVDLAGGDLDAAADILRKGGLIWAGFGTGTFTSQGHLMVIRKVSDDGQSFYIADPLSEGGITNGESNTKAYTKAELTGEGNLTSMYGFYK